MGVRISPLSTSAPGAFRAIWRVVARIPPGRVATYGQVARICGLPGGARTVGWALRALPEGLRIGGRPVPWHRVVGAQARISPRGGGEGDLEVLRQEERLRREGIAVREGRLVGAERHLWRGPRRRTGAAG